MDRERKWDRGGEEREKREGEEVFISIQYYNKHTTWSLSWPDHCVIHSPENITNTCNDIISHSSNQDTGTTRKV